MLLKQFMPATCHISSEYIMVFWSQVKGPVKIPSGSSQRAWLRSTRLVVELAIFHHELDRYISETVVVITEGE